MSHDEATGLMTTLSLRPMPNHVAVKKDLFNNDQKLREMLRVSVEAIKKNPDNK